MPCKKFKIQIIIVCEYKIAILKKQKDDKRIVLAVVKNSKASTHL